MNKECKESMLKYSSLFHENNNLKEKLVIILFNILFTKHNHKTINLMKFSFRMKQMN